MSKNRSTYLLYYLFFFILIWIAYFLRFRAFGLYEDDYFFIGYPANQTFQELLISIRTYITDIEGGQGRFIGFSIPFLLTFFAYKIGGIGAVYVLGSLLLLLNASLIFRVLSKIIPLHVAAFGAIIYILFPADTTKPLLIHIFQLQLSVTFILFALSAFLNKQRLLSYILAFCSLLTYENAFLPFLVIPLFIYPWDKKMIRQLFYHLAICFSFFIVLFLMRKIMGESRVAELDMLVTLKRMVGSVVIGPLVSIYAFVIAMYEAVISINELKWIFIAGIVIFGIWIFFIFKWEGAENETKKSSLKKFSLFKKAVDGEVKQPDLIKLIIAAIIMLIASYLLAFTHFPPTTLHGRSTSVHLASSISCSILVTLIFYLIIILVGGSKVLTNILRVLTVLFLALLIGRAYLIQNDFSENWKIQRNFWKQIVQKAPDTRNNTIIISSIDDLRKDIKDVMVYSWPVPIIYDQLFEFNEKMTHPPKVVIPGVTYENKIMCDQQGLYFEPVYSFLFENREKVYLEDSNLIYLKFTHGQANRIDTTLLCDSAGVHTMKSMVEIDQHFKQKPIGKLILNE